MITYEQVKDVVQRLKAQEITPSRKRVRMELGEGSFETIGQLIDLALAELGYAAEDPPENTPEAGYNPPPPDPGEVEGHLSTLRTQAAIAAARSHLKALCGTLRCLAPALDTVQPHLHQQFQAALQAAGPAAALSMFRPKHQEAMDALITTSPGMLEAAEVMLPHMAKTFWVIVTFGDAGGGELAEALGSWSGIEG
jgi:hypothetical protein